MVLISAGLGDSFAVLRPDRVLRCILRVGSSYVLAWVAIAVAVAVPVAARALLDVPNSFLVQVLWLLADWVLVMYAGFVAFRTLGLVYRHFRPAFPWPS